MPNHLILENSPYLLQHKDNPVEWFPWGSEALEKARAEDKPIFLSIGYAACHWCHVMAHESFEDPETAALMNEHFVNIKVDREERPDLDGIYMNAVVAMTGQGGWPMSVFLTPDLQPFYGGTYFPPVRRYNIPGFKEILLGVARAWQNSRQDILESGEKLTAHLHQVSINQPGQEPFGRIGLEKAAMALAQGYDWENGGWGNAPKFPQPMVIEYLLRRAQDGDTMAREMALHALQKMSRGGMYDVVGGGFARYSTDDQWLVPHFEKMLYDNAQLALAYLHGYLVCRETSTGSPDTAELQSSARIFKRICTETLDFIQRELADPQGGFYSSLDADSEGEEGKYYLWSLEEIHQALEPAEAEFYTMAYGITARGNFEGRTVLQRALTDKVLAESFNLSIDQMQSRLDACHASLLKQRSQRIRPGCDDKVLTSWNALALVAFSEAARYLERPDYLEVARRNATFLLKSLHLQDRLLRSWRAGQARHNAYLEDYGSLILGLLALYQSDPDVQWYSTAVKLAEDMLAAFSDAEGGGFFDTRTDHEALLVRPRDIQDNATPSGGALATLVLLQLSAYNGRGDWRDLAESALSSVQQLVMRYPTGFAFWLLAADFAAGPTNEAALVGPWDDPNLQALRSALWSKWRPRLVAAFSTLPLTPGAPELLNDRTMLASQPTAYICKQFFCLNPVTNPDDLLANLQQRGPS